MRAFSPVFACLLALTVACPAQSFDPAEDLEVARGLVARHLHAPALDLLGRICAEPTVPVRLRAEAQLEVANVFKDQFGQARTHTERTAASKKADAAYRKYLTEFSEHPRVLDAKIAYAEFLSGLGRYHRRIVEDLEEQSGSPDAIETHRAAALARVRMAADLLDELAAEIPNGGRKRHVELLPSIAHSRNAAYLEIALVEDDPARRFAALEDGIASIEDLIFENEANSLGLWSYILLGLCLREVDESERRDDALGCFEGVFSALNPDSDPGEWSRLLKDPVFRELFEVASWRLAETLNRFGRPDEAIKRVGAFDAVLVRAGVKPGSSGLRVRLEKARALRHLGQLPEAVGVVTAVSDLAGPANRTIHYRCNRLLSTLLDGLDDSAGLDAGVVFQAAHGAYGQGRYHEALSRYQTCLALGPRTAERVLECWDQIGRCYDRLGFEREAALAAATAAFLPASDGAKRKLALASRAQTLLRRIVKRTRNPADRARLDRHRERMREAFGVGGKTPYERGLGERESGRSERALEAFRRVPPESPNWERAQVHAANCLIELAETAVRARSRTRGGRKAALEARRNRMQEAVKVIDRLLASLGPRPDRGDRERNLASAWLTRAIAMKGLERWSEALAALDHLATKAASRADLRSKELVVRFHCLVELQRLEEAEAALEQLSAAHPRVRSRYPNLPGILGAAYRRVSARRERAGQTSAAVDALRKSVRFRRAWLKEADPGAESRFSLARDLYALNRFADAGELLEALLDRWGSTERESRRLKKTLRLSRRYLARSLVWMGKYVEAEPIYRRLHEARKKDRRLLEEYASLLSGTVRAVDGKLRYLPGLASRREHARKGFKLWQQIVRASERGVGEDDILAYVEARFHQYLISWAQGRGETVARRLESLREILGPPKRGGPRHEWHRRLTWLAAMLRRHRVPPGSPPAPPSPIREP